MRVAAQEAECPDVGVWTRFTRDASVAWPSGPSKQVVLPQRQVPVLFLGRWHVTLDLPAACLRACPRAGAAHRLPVTPRAQALSQEAGLGEPQSQMWASAGAGPRLLPAAQEALVPAERGQVTLALLPQAPGKDVPRAGAHVGGLGTGPGLP